MTCQASWLVHRSCGQAGRSCAVPGGGPGLSNCGMSSESCCTSLQVLGGMYYRTYQNDVGHGPVGQADPAIVSGYRLDKYDVTVGRFRQFVAAWNNGSGYTPSAGSGRHGHLNGGLGLGQLPIILKGIPGIQILHLTEADVVRQVLDLSGSLLRCHRET